MVIITPSAAALENSRNTKPVLYVQSPRVVVAFPGPPRVRINSVSNSLRKSIILIMVITKSVGVINGSVILRNIWFADAPSTRAASYKEGEIAVRAARTKSITKGIDCQESTIIMANSALVCDPNQFTFSIPRLPKAQLITPRSVSNINL